MATRRKVGKKRPRKPATRRPKPMDDDEALGEQLLRDARAGAGEFRDAFAKALKELGIQGKAIGRKKLREQMIKRGFDPTTNEFSRGIIEMREE